MTRTKSANNDKRPLNADAWATAALDAISRRGLDGIAVEPLARELGVTKGSFYWHFANGKALLEHALQLWEQQETQSIIDSVGDETDPRRRIQRLITTVNASRRASRIYQALATAPDNPTIAAHVRRVSENRLHFLLECYTALGLAAEKARQWALMTYSVFLGTLQVRRDLPDEWPTADDPALTDYVHFLFNTLVPDSVGEPEPSTNPN